MSKTRRKNTSALDRATAYARAVQAGTIVAGPHVRAACARHLRDLEEGPSRGLRWDVTAAAHVIGFFEEVLHLNGGQFEGEPFRLLSWQDFVIGSLFGWKIADGTRRFRLAYIETGKGSGKSPLLSGIGIYMLSADKEPRAEVYAAAYKKDQARVLFRDAVAMVEQSPLLTQQFHISGRTEKSNIAHLSSASFFRPVSTEERGKGQSGPRPSCALLDEIHEHGTNAMVEFMRAGTKGRRQPLICMITNSGSDRLSVCFDYHDYAAKVCDGTLEDDTFFGYVCSLDKLRGPDGQELEAYEDPFQDRSCWIKANPSMGVTFPEKYLEDQVRQAKGMPSKQNLVLRLNFCRWTDAQSAWLSQGAWERVEADVQPEAFRERSIVLALDLSARRDLTALACAVPQQDGSLDAWVEFWTPGDTLRDRSNRDLRNPDLYARWVREGFLTAAPGASVDYAFVAHRLAEIAAQYDVVTLVYDRWRIEELKQELDKLGIVLPMQPCGQGFRDMGPAVDNLENAIANTTMRVQRNPVLRWNVASVTTMSDPAGAKKFTKQKSTGRIDGVVALAMAISAASGVAHAYVQDEMVVW